MTDDEQDAWLIMADKAELSGFPAQARALRMLSTDEGLVALVGERIREHLDSNKGHLARRVFYTLDALTRGLRGAANANREVWRALPAEALIHFKLEHIAPELLDAVPESVAQVATIPGDDTVVYRWLDRAVDALIPR